MKAIFEPKILEAGFFAAIAHKGQVRKFSGDPYIVHPFAVSKYLLHNLVDVDVDTLVAALLHDVVEDTEVSLLEIENKFGYRVANLVNAVTNVDKPEMGNRAFRKALNRAHLKKAPPEAQNIKYADIIDNVPGFLEHDPKFAKVYVPEKILALDVMDKGDHILRQKAYDVCEGRKR